MTWVTKGEKKEKLEEVALTNRKMTWESMLKAGRCERQHRTLGSDIAACRRSPPMTNRLEEHWLEPRLNILVSVLRRDLPCSSSDSANAANSGDQNTCCCSEPENRERTERTAKGWDTSSRHSSRGAFPQCKTPTAPSSTLIPDSETCVWNSCWKWC